MTFAARLGAAALALACAAAPPRAAAQSIVTGDVEGVVVDAAGQPVSGVLMTLRPRGGAGGRVSPTARDGAFVFSFLAPGRYELQAEALGRRPILVEEVRIEAGRAATVRVVLPVAGGPIDRRDTIRQAGLPAAGRGSATWLAGATLTTLPADGPELARVLELAGPVDPAGGLEGLPERSTTMFIDAHPFRPARHPAAASDPARALVLPRTAVSGLALPRGSDVEWGAGSGSAVALTSGVDRGGVPELTALVGPAAAWSGAALEGETPSFTSLWLQGATTLSLIADTARLHVAVEGGSRHRPLPALVTDSVAALLGESGAGLALPGLGESTWTSGSATLEWTLARGGMLRATLAGAAFTDELATSSSPSLRYLAQPAPLEGTDLVAGASLAVALRGPLALEVRARGSTSRRTFGPESPPGTATALVDPSVGLGGPLQDAGEVRRTEVGGTAAVHFSRGPHRAKGGLRASVAAHRFDLRQRARGTFLFGEASGVRGPGLFVEQMGTLPAISFAVPEGELFGQYRWAAGSGVTFTVGGRYGLVVFPLDAVRLDTRWLDLTNLANQAIPEQARYAGGIAHGAWDPTGGGRTVLEAGLTLEQGEVDPAALYELIENSGLLTVRRVGGAQSSWPTAPASEGLRGASLTLLDPDLAPPVTSRAVVGFAQRFGGATTLRVEASVRRTELLLRRSDLNAPIEEAFLGEGNRPVLAQLEAWGGIVGPTGGGWRRFGEYDAVWALSGDGWSRYRGLSVALDQPFARGGLGFASYTWSETRDNLFGLAAGDPRATLPPGIPGTGSTPWEEGISDLDIPHRLTAGISVPLGPARLGAVFRLRSGAPFTPMVARGLDVNGDGSWTNDVAFVPATDDARSALAAAGCGGAPAGGFPARNSCRGPSVQELDLRVGLGPLPVGRAGLELLVELANATDQESGIRDDALLRLAPNGRPTVGGTTVTIPYGVNPAFGQLVERSDRGRQLRIGLRLGAPR